MADPQEVDYYEVLQVSPGAAPETIDRVFRFLAKQYHPDNPETGDAERFALLTDAFRTLSDPQRRVEYDLRYERIRAARWRFLDPDSAADEFRGDAQIQGAILSLLYSARRKDVDHPGMGIYEVERLLDCPEEHMKFHMWYLRENGWVERLDNGQWAITAGGVDRVRREGTRSPDPHLLPRGPVVSEAPDSEPVPGGSASG